MTEQAKANQVPSGSIEQSAGIKQKPFSPNYKTSLKAIEGIIKQAALMSGKEQDMLYKQFMQAGLMVKDMAESSASEGSDTETEEERSATGVKRKKAPGKKGKKKQKLENGPKPGQQPAKAPKGNQNTKTNKQQPQGPGKAGPSKQTKNNPKTTEKKEKVKPIVVEGLTQEEKANHFKADQRLKIKDMIYKAIVTKGDKYLIFPTTEINRNLIMASDIEGITMRDPIERKERQEENKTTYVVLENVHPSISDEEIAEATGFTAKRIISGRTQKPTWKVKIDTNSDEIKENILKHGIKIGYQNYRGTEYKSFRAPLMCFKCQQFDHISSTCKNEERCKKCSGNHNHKDCENDTMKCVNCGKDHPSTFRGCPIYQQHARKIEGEKLSYAQAVAKPLNDMEALRLATTLVLTSNMLAKKLNVRLSIRDIASDITSIIADVYKSHIDIAYINENITKIMQRKTNPTT